MDSGLNSFLHSLYLPAVPSSATWSPEFGYLEFRSDYLQTTVDAATGQETLEVLLDKAIGIATPFDQSFFIIVHLLYLQPFVDINKRTSQLVMNLASFRANLCLCTFSDMP